MTASDTAPVRSDETLDEEGLERYLRGRLPGATGPMRVEQFPHGHSNLTYLLRFDGVEYVLRRPPLGPVAPTAHDMSREYRVLSAVWRPLPVAPRPLLLCEDASVIGGTFYVMERRRGIVIREALPPELRDDLSLRGRVSEAAVDTLAKLHRLDWKAVGLGGRPMGYLERQVRGWAERYDRAKTRDIPEVRELERWLAARMPAPGPPALLHNDFKFDNLMLDAADPTRVVAVLDWEMAAIGEPLADLGGFLAYWPERADPPARREVVGDVTTYPGFLTRAELVERYQSLTGLDISNVRFYEVFGLYKLAVIVQQIYSRYHRGQTQDERFAVFEDRVVGLAEAACDIAWGKRH